MNALDLFQLGRWLAKIGEEAMRPSGAPETPPGVRLILMDAFAFPDSSIGEIATRTGLPQSYVSETVARMREQGAFQTRSDPADGRRTLVKVSSTVPETVARLGTIPVDDVLIKALGDTPPETAADLVAALTAVAAQLRATRGGPGSIAHRLSGAGDHAR
ncbi:MAG TPA: helix-turn-helix domain-containing protein [Streptosporangiaceae bacterium]|nr:helix-turn-helix domain-containing protein [Streptosporangiaceae bacterium]